MKCHFCEAEGMVNFELEANRILALCEVHFNKLRQILTAQSIYVPSPQEVCQHEFESNATVQICRKCGKTLQPFIMPIATWKQSGVVQ